jgi:RHS repeat-associated protein
VNGTTYRYYYAGGKLMRMTWGTNTIDFFYDANGTPYAMKYNGTVYYYVTNLQGDVMRIVDASGTVMASYDYDPYGKVISATGTLANINPLRYRGYVYDQETGFYYLNSRYYDPAVGRFISADRQLALKNVIGTNLFAYCFNNPVSLGDGKGNWPKWVEKVAFVASVVVTVAAVAVTVAAVSAFTAGTGSALAVYGASIFLGAALSGLNGAIANASQGNSYFNGYVGGASAGATQAAASKLPGGTIWGGAGGTGIGTAITMGLNNLDPDSSNSSGREIARSVGTSTVKAAFTSSITAFWGEAIGGINYNTGTITGAASNGSNGLMPTLTVGFAEGLKAFWGAVDDAFVYVWG